MRYQYPHTIENGGGEKITFLGIVNTGDSEIIEVENEVQPGHGPPMHVHFKQSESLTVLQGKMGTQTMGEKPHYLGVGDTVVFEAGSPHKFWNAGEEPLICKGFAKPPHNLEYFLTEIYKSTKANGGKMPGKFDGAFLMKKYNTEFQMLEIPGFVRNVIFPIVLFFGKLAGKHKKFADAPDAM